MRTIGVIINDTKPRAGEALRQVAKHAERLELRLFAEPSTIALAGGGPPWTPCPVRNFAGVAEVAVALGGDGTLLQAAHRLQESQLPLMGFNIGSLGYLTCVDEAHFDVALRALREDRYRISERITLAGQVRRRDGSVEDVDLLALNEIVALRGATGKLVRLGLTLDDRQVTTYACDGLIVATPTGSTAYSLSAGGPILVPGTQALAIGVICPHALGARPLVIPESTVVGIRVEGSNTPLLLAVDGVDGCTLDNGDVVIVRRSEQKVRIVLLEDHDPYAVLSHKLGWGGRAL